MVRATSEPRAGFVATSSPVVRVRGEADDGVVARVHAPYATRWNASRHAGIFVRQGWDELADRVRTSMAHPKNYSANRP